jgi:hypothetical protein
MLSFWFCVVERGPGWWQSRTSSPKESIVLDPSPCPGRLATSGGAAHRGNGNEKVRYYVVREKNTFLFFLFTLSEY